VADRGVREIDADGAIVTPGFVDIHTHYDGQATWDERLQPSSAMGSPPWWLATAAWASHRCAPGRREHARGAHGRVEDLPGVVLHEGLSWEWESIGDFLDALDRRRYDVDLAAQVCHAPVRVYVMGERGANREPATVSAPPQLSPMVETNVSISILHSRNSWRRGITSPLERNQSARRPDGRQRHGRRGLTWVRRSV